ncbi:MAG: hypothetical protein WCY86_04925 [Spirosomataceae bacterium]
MEKQAEFHEYTKIIRQVEKVVQDLKWQQKELGIYKRDDLVRYQGEVGIIASVNNMGETLKYTVAKLRKDGCPIWGTNLVWYAEEEELQPVKLVPRKE